MVWVERFELSASWTPFAICQLARNARKVGKSAYLSAFFIVFKCCQTPPNAPENAVKNALFFAPCGQNAVSFGDFWRWSSRRSSRRCELATHPRQDCNQLATNLHLTCNNLATTAPSCTRAKRKASARTDAICSLFVICYLFSASGKLNPCASISARIRALI